MVDLFAPTIPVDRPPVVLCCLPGGGMSRRYWDLRAQDERGTYSMGDHLASHGFTVVTLDHLGVGESSRPEDPYTLTPAVVADANAYAVDRILRQLRDGSLGDDLTLAGNAIVIGVGHSMGGLLTVWQQARHHTYAAIAVLGFAGGGLVRALNDDQRRFAGDPEGLQRELARLVRESFGDALPPGTTATSDLLLAGMPVPSAVIDALGESSSNLLALVGLTSMVPGSSAPQLAAIDVPVFIGVGERDITGDAHQIPAQFPHSLDVTLFALPDAGHNHNAAPNRAVLWDRLAAWARSVEVPKDT